MTSNFALGHRDRLRERFEKAGEKSLADYELLEMFLFLVIKRRDTKPIAKSLLKRFGNIENIMEANQKLLMEVEGVGPSVVHALKLHQAMVHRQLRHKIIKKPILSSWDQVLDYCALTMAYAICEQLRLLFLNTKNQLIHEEVHQVGSIDQIPIYPREIVKRAIELGAKGIILVHNHPSGDPTPSDWDYEITKTIQESAQFLNVKVLDHIIIGKGKYVSILS